MIHQILVRSRKQIEDCIGTFTSPTPQPWALISIWNTSELVHVFTRKVLEHIGCQHAISLRFADMTPEELSKLSNKEHILFNQEHAKNIIDFINKVNMLDIPILVVHCAAGISRSAAVGLFACRYLRLSEEEFRKTNRHILPNFHILKVLNDVSGLEEEYMKFWQTSENIEKRLIMFNCSYGREK